MLQTFLHALAAVTIIFLLTATGYLCGEKGWMTAESKAFISKFLLSLAVPCMCVYGLRSNLTREMIAGSLKMLSALVLCDAINFALAAALARLLKLPRRRSGVFIAMCALSNAIFIGYPMCLELFGEPCVPYVMLYYLVNTSFTQTLGMYLIRRCADNESASWRQTLRFLRSPTVLGVLAGFALVLLDVRLPAFLTSYLRYMNGVVSPLALLLTGYIIHEIGLAGLRVDRALGAMTAFRFLLAPSVSAVCCALFGVTGLARGTFLIESAMPVVTQLVVAATQYGADEGFAARGAALTALASFVAIPLLAVFL